MKSLNGKNYIELNEKGCIIRPTENITLREIKESKSVRTQYQVRNETKKGEKQRFIKNEINELEVKPFPKRTSNRTNNEQPNKQLDIEYPSCKQRSWDEFDTS